MHLTLFQILALLGSGPADALTLLERLGRLAPSDVPSLPALYRHLRRGLDESWLVVVGTEEGDSGPGRPRQIYRITAEGAAAVRARARALDTFTALALEESGGEGT